MVKLAAGLSYHICHGPSHLCWHDSDFDHGGWRLKSVQLITLPKLPFALETTKLLFSHVFPNDIVSDRDPQFYIIYLNISLGSYMSLSSEFHSETNGQHEHTKHESKQPT